MMADLSALAAVAGGFWGGFAAQPVLVAERENAVFRTMLADRRPVALRLHRPGYLDDAAIAEEMAICEALADAGLACPWPYRTTQGGFVAHIGEAGYRATVVQWIEGTCLSDLPEAQMPLPVRYRALGELLADFHLTADSVAPSPGSRPAWSADRLTGGTCSWGDMVADPELTREEKNLIGSGRNLARSVLDRIGGAGQGLIHGDVLPDNVLMGDGGLFLIDFDDCGPGYRLYDLATALISLAGAPEMEMAADALWQGYVDAGGPLPAPAFKDLPVFLMLRAHASAAWARGRCAPGDPRRRAYRERALALTRIALTA